MTEAQRTRKRLTAPQWARRLSHSLQRRLMTFFLTWAIQSEYPDATRLSEVLPVLLS